jgi:hypothetical protein
MVKIKKLSPPVIENVNVFENKIFREVQCGGVLCEFEIV